MLMIAVVSLCILLVFAACAGGDNDKTPTPAPTDITTSIPWDTNGDGLFTPQELEATFAQMRKEVNVIAESQPSVAARFEAEIASFENTLRNEPYKLDMAKIQITVSELIDVVQAPKDH
jgi:ABC-type glycerol-3-phosphate transport system substrate-binding protein